MNPLLGRLQPYPFEKLRALTAGVAPDPALAPINLSIGEPKHPTPEFVKAALAGALAGLAAYPLAKGSGAVTAFSLADGFVSVPALAEAVEAGTQIAVTLIGRGVRPADLVVIGSHCVGLDRIAGLLAERGIAAKILNVGSLGGLAAARRGECDLAPMHLLDPATGLTKPLWLLPGMSLEPADNGLRIDLRGSSSGRRTPSLPTMDDLSAYLKQWRSGDASSDSISGVRIVQSPGRRRVLSLDGDVTLPAAGPMILMYGLGAMVGPLIGSVAMSRLGTDGFVWTTVVFHVAIALFLIIRMFQYREPLRARPKPWNEVALAGRVFYVPVTVIGMGRRLLARRREVVET